MAIWIDFNLWEDYQNGMYEKGLNLETAKKCYNLLKENCYNEMKQVTQEWENTTKVNLSKEVFNNKAWLGQACCSFHFNATIEETTWAWVRLTKEERTQANNCASRVIREWQSENL